MKRCLAVFLCITLGVAQAGSKERDNSLRRQNHEAHAAGFRYIENDQVLEEYKSQGLLLPIEESEDIRAGPDWRTQWHFVLPHTLLFVKREAARFSQACHKPTQYNSAVRTIDGQSELKKNGNRNAANTNGELRSVHPTGSAVDIAKMPVGPSGRKVYMSLRELLWWKRELRQLQEQNLIIMDDEYHQAVFHVMVLPKYAETELPPPLRCTWFKRKVDRH